jgi:hypothetical protein
MKFSFCPINQNIVDSAKCAQNSVFLIAKWHLTDTTVHKPIF